MVNEQAGVWNWLNACKPAHLSIGLFGMVTFQAGVYVFFGGRVRLPGKSNESSRVAAGGK